MLELTPCYFNKFSCIADKCKHNCCIGWEIDIDEDTMEYYNSMDTPLGKRIRQNVEGEEPHFVLKENERCPFLNSKNLCDIISELGEDGLCDICRLHPRFRNYYDSFCETGLGLCCEEAARIILSEKEKFSIELDGDVFLTDEEKTFLSVRNDVFSLICDRSKSIKERFLNLAEGFGFEFDFYLSEICQKLLSLERLCQDWTKELEDLSAYDFDESIFKNSEYSLCLENLAVYFVFRHFNFSIAEIDYALVIRFALLCVYVIAAIWSMKKLKTIEELSEVARMLSSEIEYSPENTESLIYTE